MPARVTTAIVGGGAAGALVATHLLRRRGAGRIAIIERGVALARGVAYGTRDPGHLLNVPAGRMSLSSTAPDDFVAWLHLRGRTDATGASFVARGLYGDYLADALTEAGRGGELEIVEAEAVSAEVGASTLVGLANGESIEAESIVLAIGNPSSAGLPAAAPALHRSPRYVSDPWAPGALDSIEGGHVVLVGSGLTAIDTALTLAARPVRLSLVSRHGLLPHAHTAASPDPLPQLDPASGLLALLRRLRAVADQAEDWRSVVDGLRPETQRLWGELSRAERERFLEHLGSYWNVHRHRMAPEVAARIADLRRDGRLVLEAGRVTGVEDEGSVVAVRVVSRGTGSTVTLRGAYVVNCTGPRLRLADDPPRLVRDLVDLGLARFDPLGIGLETDADGALLGDSGAPRRHYAVGTVRRGTLWESTAIPELRAQAERLATVLVETTDDGSAAWRPTAPGPAPPARTAG